MHGNRLDADVGDPMIMAARSEKYSLRIPSGLDRITDFPKTNDMETQAIDDR